MFFDNLTVQHYTGPLTEENVYYPFGLAMAGISSKAVGRLENKRKYNGIEYENSFDLNMGETFFRMHDPQIGRWWQIDPKAELDIGISPFAAMNNNPISRIDPLGDNDYKVNNTGEITLVKETKDETDRLIAVNGNKEKIKYDKKGNLKNASILLDKGILAKKTEGEDKITDEGKQVKYNFLRLDFKDKEGQAQKVFEFLSDNTQVERAKLTYETNRGEGSVSSIYTSHLEDREYSSPQFSLNLAEQNKDILVKFTHSHNHPSNSLADHSDADSDFRDKVLQHYPNAQFFTRHESINYNYNDYKKKKK